MARIRTIKPDFWTDEKIVELSFEARLFFIGSWNFADDNGNLQRSAKKLKMQIFPADAIDCEPLIQSLMTHGLLIEYTVNGEKYLHIKGFNTHQVINRPSKTGLPVPNSGTTPTPLTEPSLTEAEAEAEAERNGMEEEGKGKEEAQVVHPREAEDETPDRAAPASRAVEIAVYLRQRGIVGANSANPNIAGWGDDVRVTNEMLEAAMSIARSRKGSEPVGPNYLATIMPDLLNPKPVALARASPMNARDESRRRAYEQLTGKTQSHEPSNGNVIDVTAKLLG